MRSTFRHISIFIICLISSFSAKATHIVGGEMTYEYFGNNVYEITVNMFYDCETGSGQALAMDTVIDVSVFRSRDLQLLNSYRVQYNQVQSVRNLNYACLKEEISECVIKRTYTVRLTLADIKGGYTIAYQRCCRNMSIVNLIDADNEGSTLFVAIPERAVVGNNSSPVFDKLPPNFLCLGQPLSFKHTATDKDGDSLYYHLALPFHGADENNPKPGVPNLSNLRRINYNTQAGYGLNYMVTGNPTLSINPVSGQLKLIPTRTGRYVVGIAVSEYRNGQLIGTTIRDFQLNVIRCQFDVVSAFTTPDQRCDREVSFSNLSQGASSFSWNFGDPSTTSDVSTNSNPSYTYPKAGTYTIQLIAKTNNCEDTFEREIRIPHDTELYAGPDTLMCPGKSVQIGVAGGYPGTKYSWTPATFLSNPNISNPFASPPSTRSYRLRKEFEDCFAEDDIEIRVGPPKPDFGYEPLPYCGNLAVKFNNTSEFSTSYEWDFGTGDPSDNSNKKNPTFEFPKPGIYQVKLTTSLNNECEDEEVKNISVVLDTTSFAGPDKDICFGDTIWLGVPNQYSGAQFSWTPSDKVSFPNFPRVQVSPEKSTVFIVTRTFPECSLSDTVEVKVDKPDPFSKLAYTPPCDGLNVKLYNRSKNCEKLLWDFGVENSNQDTSTSLDSVSFAYPENGKYTITITGTSPKGCENEYEIDLNVIQDTGLFAGPDTNLCLGESLVLGLLDTVSFAHFKWKPANMVSDDTLQQPSITPTERMVYYAEKVYPECTFYDSVVVGVWNPEAAFKNKYDPHCDGLEVKLENTSIGADKFRWDFDHEGGQVEDTAKIVTKTFSEERVYQISLFASKKHCGDTSKKSIKVYLDTGAYAIPDTVVCLRDSIKVGRADTAALVEYSWQPSKNVDDPNSSNPWVYPSKTGTYIVERRFPNCTYFDSVSLRVAEPFALFDTSIYTNCDGFTAELTNLSDKATNYTWVFSNGQSSIKKDELQYFDFGQRFKAQLVAHDAHCFSTYAMEAQLRPFDDFKVITPNVFTPNDDGFNDCYSILVPDLPENCHGFEILIFNRWGQKVFAKQVQDNNYCWDGTSSFNGHLVSAGTYFVIINVKGRNFNGTVTVAY
ncbi:MAG: PKD domain-containing protein [Bacteroidetes bacterium]|nr:PKD domain-containing protein [Bacteroidota bacterium]